MANDVEDESNTLQGANLLPDTELTVCNICGESHYTDCCTLLSELKPVKDTPTISRARLTLPSGLKVVSLADATTTVVACVKFDQGTHFGPFQAHLTTDLHPGVSLPLKIIGKSGSDGYYLDSTDEETCNWMCLVAPASTASEQNLICYDMKQSIYFTAIKDILPGEELRVWYAVYYGLKLQALPLADESDTEDGLLDLPGNDLEPKLKIKNMGQEIGRELLESLAQHLPAHSLGARTEKDLWQCRFCDKEEQNVSLYAKHLMFHCRPKCELCNSRFISEKALSKHKKTVHEGEECKGKPSQQIIKESINIPTSDLLNNQEKSINDDETKETLTENWGQNETERKAEETGETKLPDDEVAKENYESFCPLISVDKDNQEIITVENLDRADIVQTQLVLADDGSVVYHVANIPDGILSAEMDKLGMLVVNDGNCSDAAEGWSAVSNDLVVNDGNCSETAEGWSAETNDLVVNDGNCSEAAEGWSAVSNDLVVNDGNCSEAAEGWSAVSNDLVVNDGNCSEAAEGWSAVSNDLVVNDGNCSEAADGLSAENNDLDSALETAKDAAENSNSLHGIEPRINDAKLESGTSVAFILLNTLEHKDQSLTKRDELFNQQELNERSDVDMQMINTTKNDVQDIVKEEQKSTDPFACDICSKTFEKRAYLYRHLRKHTGEFTCVNCLVVFARKENLQSHPCTRPMPKYPCHLCGRKFTAKKYLQRHIPLHTGEYTCEKCKRSFVSKLSLASHRCRTDDISKDPIKCSLCEQIFPDQIKLQTHLMHHSETDQDGNRAYLPSTPATRKLRRRKPTAKVAPETKPESISVSLGTNIDVTTLNLPPKENHSTATDNGKGFICEICGSIFKSFSSMNTHRYLHGERRFECKTCGKKFHRKDVLQEHITVHQTPQLPCSDCGKKLKTKKSLEVHMMIHAGAKRFTCNDCGKEFHQKGNMLKHQRVHTPAADRIYPCQHCNKNFTSREYLSMHILEHTQGKIFQCPHCSKSYVKKHLLEVHYQSSHSNRAFLCRYCNNFMRHRHSARRHLEQRHPDKQSEWSQPGFVDLMLAELPEDTLLRNNGGGPPGQQDIHQDQLLAVRRQHFGSNLNTGKEDINATNPPNHLPMEAATSPPDHLPMEAGETLSVANATTKTHENQDITMEEIAFTLEQQVELLADPLLSTPQLQLDAINVIPVPFEEKKQGEEILLEVIDSQIQENMVVNQNDTNIMVPLNVSDTSASKEENAQLTIGGNTYILQDRVIFDEDEMSGGDIFLYVLDSQQ